MHPSSLLGPQHSQRGGTFLRDPSVGLQGPPAGWGQGCACKAFTHVKAEAMEAPQYQGAKEEGWERGRGGGTVVLLVTRDWPDLPVFCC